MFLTPMPRRLFQKQRRNIATAGSVKGAAWREKGLGIA